MAACGSGSWASNVCLDRGSGGGRRLRLSRTSSTPSKFPGRRARERPTRSYRLGLVSSKRLLRVCLSSLLLACESTALSLGSPNEVNVVLSRTFIGQQVDAQVLRLEGADTGEGESIDSATLRTFSILDTDFGEGLGATEFVFEHRFVLRFTIVRYADAVTGRRPFGLRIRNDRGTFVAHGELTVY